jgi:tetratricopeptide (TPR) repeat protein
LLFGGFASAQTSGLAQSRAKSPERQTQEHHASEADAELARRIAAAQAARKSGNAAAIGAANGRLAALALREMAQMRLLQVAYGQAIELYQRSLDFDDIPETHIDLAIAYLQANELDKSLAESAKALAIKPDDVRGQIVRGKTLMSKGEYAEAAKVLQRATESKSDADLETMYSLAVCYLQSKQSPELVAGVFKKIVERTGDSGSLHVLFGRAYRDANDLPSAIVEFQRAIALNTRTPHAHYFLGLARLANNEWKVTPETNKEFLKELEFYPHDYLANYMVGFVASGERQYDFSDKYLGAAIKINPDWPEPYLYMGLNASARGDKTEAEKMFRKAIELTGKDESRSNFQIRRAYIDLGRMLVSSGRREEGEMYLGKARELQNKVFQHSQQNMATMALSGGIGAAAAIVPLAAKSETEAAPLVSTNVDPFARLDAAVVARANLTPAQLTAAEQQENRLRAVLALAFNDMATSEAVSGEYMAALGHYQEAEKWDAKIPGLARNLGLSAFKATNYPVAIRGLTISLQENPADVPVRAMLGMTYFATEKYADAVNTFKPLGTRGMQDGTVGYAWAASLTKLQEPAEAAQVLEEFQKPERPNETRMLIGQLWIDIGDYAKAVEAFHSLLQSNPQTRKAHYFAGQADIRWGHWADAEKEFKDELKLDPGDLEAKYNLGFVFLQQSRVDDAAAIFEEVVKAYPDHARAQYNLGKIMLDRGNLDEAVKHLEIAARLSPESDYMHYQLQVAYRKQSRIADADRELAVYKDIKEKKRGASTSGMGSAQSQNQ